VKPRSSPSIELPPVENFLQTVYRSGVLGEEQVEASLGELPDDLRDDTAALSDHLVETGKLSRFQAEKLLQGISAGLVLGPFHVMAPIARGGMGMVYLARDSRSDQLIALKVLPPKLARTGGRMLARFQREMEMSQLVSHPHVAYTFEVGLCQGVYYIAMEYIPGRNLFRLVTDDGPLTVPRAARLFAEVALALDHAHTRGLIHRDLKPSNIIVTPHDHAKLLDLGLALIQGEDVADRTVVGGRGYVVGTMDYLAPEQAADAAAVDARSDIYSLGCTLYFALTGQPPFPGGTPREKLQRHRDYEPAPIPTLNPNVPPAFIGLLRHMMRKSPKQRIASAAEVRDRLLAWAGSDAGQPLDERGDKEYQEAVIALETSTAPAELLAEVIPVGIPVKRKRRRPPTPAQPEPPVRSPLERPKPAFMLIYLVLAGLLGLAVFAAAMLWRFRH
jgi:serine/threonine protein kinase